MTHWTAPHFSSSAFPLVSYNSGGRLLEFETKTELLEQNLIVPDVCSGVSHFLTLVSALPGILLNDQMDDFSTPGQSNVYGLAPSAPNFIRPGKRPLSSMSPLIFSEPSGRLRIVAGGSGGPRIVSGVLSAVLR